MKKAILFSLICTMFLACSKSNVAPEENTKQGVEIEFVTTGLLSGGEQVERAYTAKVVMIWKADGKDLQYNSISDGEFAYDNTSKKSIKADYSYSDVSNKTIDLPAGKYFITIVTGNDAAPRGAWSYTNFNIEKGKYITVKKNISGMNSLQYNAW